MTSSADFLFIFDTNTLISGALIRNSVPSLALQKAVQLGLHCFSKTTLRELNEVLKRKKFEKYLSPGQRLEFLERILGVSRFFTPQRHFELCRDKKDNQFLDLAFCSKASFLITGDSDLLDIGTFDVTEIVNPGNFLRLVDGTHSN